jgi:hypothetical protein
MRIYAAAPQLAVLDEEPVPTAARTLTPFSFRERESDLRSSLLRARLALLDAQREDGSWCGEVTTDWGFVAKQLLTGRAKPPAAEELFEAQLPSGGWERLPGHGLELETSLLAYVALRAAGYGAHLLEMRRAFQVIQQQGGVMCCTSATRGWLRLAGVEYGVDSSEVSPLDRATELLGDCDGLDWPMLAREELEVSSPELTTIDTALVLSALCAGGLSAKSHACRGGFGGLANSLPTEVEFSLAVRAGERMLSEEREGHEHLPPALAVRSDESAKSRNARPIVNVAAAVERWRVAPTPNATSQHADGSWTSTWGYAKTCGIAEAIPALRANGAPENDPAILRGVNWLFAHQQPSGGWGEPAFASRDPRRQETAAATASQTAWGLSALVAAGLADHPAASDAVQFLLETQDEDGMWHEPHLTLQFACGAHLYRSSLAPTALAATALADWAVAMGKAVETAAPTLRVVRC